MSFWNLSDDSVATDVGKEFDGGGGSIEPMPEGTTVLAQPDEAKWSEDLEKNEYLSIRWLVLKPGPYANRRVFQKIWCSDPDPKAKDPDKKRDKALRMLAAIDANAGGKLGRKAGKPTDDDLAVALIGKPMTLRLGLWEFEGANGPMSGNWVQAVGGRDKPVSEVAEAPKRQQAQRQTAKPSQASSAFDDDDDDSDVPF